MNMNRFKKWLVLGFVFLGIGLSFLHFHVDLQFDKAPHCTTCFVQIGLAGFNSAVAVYQQTYQDSFVFIPENRYQTIILNREYSRGPPNVFTS